MKLQLPLRGGNAVNTYLLTATADKVKSGKVFVGNGDGEKATGTMPIIPPITKSMGINETYIIPAGYHNGQDNFSQSVTLLGQQNVSPSVNMQTIAIKDKYMTGNVIIHGIQGLSPEVIKYGVTIGSGTNSVTGTFQGFVD